MAFFGRARPIDGMFRLGAGQPVGDVRDVGAGGDDGGDEAVDYDG